MVKNLFEKRRLKQLRKKYEKLTRIQKEIMEHEIEVGKLEIIGMSINYYTNGVTIRHIDSKEVFEKILIPIGKLKETIPFSHKKYGDEFDLNKQFYEYRDKIAYKIKEKQFNLFLLLFE